MSAPAPAAQQASAPQPDPQAAAVPVPGQQQPPHARTGRRSVQRTSAQRVLALSVVATAVSLLVALVGVLAAQSQAAGLGRAAERTERVLTVLAVRDALLTADGAATNAFLVGGLEPQDRRAVYDDAVAGAATLLADLARGAADDDELIAGLTADLTTYTSLVEAARVNNRQGFPVGAAYLDQASTLLREEMLADLDTVLDSAADDAASDFQVTNLAWPVVVVVALALVVLVVCQVRLARITRRRLNGGLVLGTLALLVAAVGGAGAVQSAAEDATQTRTGEYRDTLAVAQASALAAEARTLESFTLIQRGSGAEFEEQYLVRVEQARELLGDEPRLLQLLADWDTLHGQIRELDDGGDWEGAVDLAITDEATGPSAAYAELSDATTALVDDGRETVREELQAASRQAAAASALLAVTGALAAVACWWGTSRRRGEYR